MKEDQYKTNYYQRDVDEFWFAPQNLPRPDELAAICYAFGRPFTGKYDDKPRDPGVIFSIGAGEGNLEKRLENMGCEVYGVDPAPGAKELYKGSFLFEVYPGGGNTIIFCESIEHLYPEQLDEIWKKIPVGARVIIVNWLDFHPIEPDGTGYDHVRRIDDDLFDQLSEGNRVIFRKGSHLVLEKLL